ncbi:hypothetical protein AURDEDRAFT_174335 [Auricularia subglabra TFB-10046 SS5]|nr:hypothetical protein AURDEDRAFT_174335 [Auricularia subglabra TFB-10046 SS5]
MTIHLGLSDHPRGNASPASIPDNLVERSLLPEILLTILEHTTEEAGARTSLVLKSFHAPISRAAFHDVVIHNPQSVARLCLKAKGLAGPVAQAAAVKIIHTRSLNSQQAAIMQRMFPSTVIYVHLNNFDASLGELSQGGPWQMMLRRIPQGPLIYTLHGGFLTRVSIRCSTARWNVVGPVVRELLALDRFELLELKMYNPFPQVHLHRTKAWRELRALGDARVRVVLDNKDPEVVAGATEYADDSWKSLYSGAYDWKKGEQVYAFLL